MPRIEISLDQLPEGIPARIEHGGKGIVVIRTGTSVSAFADRCPHARWRLSEGDYNDGVLECAGHGWRFAVPSGECLTSRSHRLQRLTVEVEQGRVAISWEGELQS